MRWHERGGRAASFIDVLYQQSLRDLTTQTSSLPAVRETNHIGLESGLIQDVDSHDFTNMKQWN